MYLIIVFFFFQAEDGIRDLYVTGVQTCALPISSMPVVVRDGGKMWGPDGNLHDTKAMIPDRCYATIYQTIIEDCQKNGALNPATMGSVPNVGLMAQKAEEYGPHDKTFELPAAGTVRLVDADGNVVLEQE